MSYLNIRVLLGGQLLIWKGVALLFACIEFASKDDAKPVQPMQCRLNPHMKEIVQKEVVKLLDAGIIYPISNS